MKERFKGFLAGIITTVLVSTMVIPAFANTISKQIQTTLNSINITVNGASVAKVGDGYVLSNGKEVPYSILYEGTTYLPLRKIGELLGLNVDWDGETKTAFIGETPVVDSPDYSNWSEEMKTGYQEFKALWDVSSELDERYNIMRYTANYNGTLTYEELNAEFNNIGNSTIVKYLDRWLHELFTGEHQIVLSLGSHGKGYPFSTVAIEGSEVRFSPRFYQQP